MIGHLFKLVWNRKRTNVLIVLEILCSFLVLFALSASAIYFWDRYRDPLGFDYEDVWYVDVARNSLHPWGEWEPEEAATFRRLLGALESMDEVVAAAGSTTAPYKGSMHITGWTYNKHEVNPEMSHVTPGFIDVLGLELVSGRWIREADSALDWTPIVVDEDLARELVGNEDPVGRRVTDEDDDNEKDYRGSSVSYATSAGEGNSVRIPRTRSGPARLDERGESAIRSSVLLVKMAPGTRPPISRSRWSRRCSRSPTAGPSTW